MNFGVSMTSKKAKVLTVTIKLVRSVVTLVTVMPATQCHGRTRVECDVGTQKKK